MKRNLFILAGICAVSVGSFGPRLLFGIDIVPATSRDIVNALGPDAKGLYLSQESLPDLFALTASRIEENPKQFIVEQPYMEGRWKGGKAVIEYARDLSYTLVSVYDKDGHRQRIYSVRTNFTEHVARQREIARAEPSAENEEDTWTRTETPSEEPAPPPPPARKQRRSSSSPSSRASAPPTRSVPAAAPVATQVGSVPSESFEWNEEQGAYVPAAGTGSAAPAAAPVQEVRAPEKETPAPQTSRRRKRRHEEEPVVVASRPMSIPAPAQSDGLWLPTPAKSKTVKPAVETVKVANTTWSEKRTTKPAETVESPAPKRRRRHAEPKSVPAPEVQTPVSSKSSREASEEWVPTPTPTPTPVRASSNVKSEEAVPSTEELLLGEEKKTETAAAPAGPDTSGGDSWVPKATPKQAEPLEPEPVAPSPTQVAMVPKAGPVDNSVDNLLKMANEGKGEMPHESDKWVPKKVEAPKPDVDLNKELVRIREQERKQAVATKPVAKIRHDINNPEEGVLPVSSFEKFSGPMYGRHREYERRFFPGKKSKPGAPDHDFYVEEVDRKKEIHNVYFYKHEKGKAPKLVAVERHEKVSFLGNYDIDKEDKGKISTY